MGRLKVRGAVRGTNVGEGEASGERSESHKLGAAPSARRLVACRFAGVPQTPSEVEDSQATRAKRARRLYALDGFIKRA